MWDWHGQRLGHPLWRLWGLDPAEGVATSVTLGLASVDAVLDRLERWWTQLPATRVKLKLGSPDGLDHDLSLLEAVAQAITGSIPAAGCGHRTAGGCQRRMDRGSGQANAGAPGRTPVWCCWSNPWLPIWIPRRTQRDSRRFTPTVRWPWWRMKVVGIWTICCAWLPVVDGVNLKLLKTGGLSQALLMAQVAQTKGLDLMVGCYSDSSLLNGAAAQMLPLIRWPDLDSHLNLVDDPFVGLELQNDRLRPSAMAGLGIRPAGGTAA